MRWAGHVARMGVKGNVCRLMGNPEGNRSLGRLRRRWVDNIKDGFRVGMGWCGLDCSGSGYRGSPLMHGTFFYVGSSKTFVFISLLLVLISVRG
jgi:hypothetical protein